MVQLLVLTAALRYTNRGRERLSRQYLELLYCFYLLSKDKPVPISTVYQRFTNTLFVAGYDRMKERTERLIQLGYLERIETGKPLPKHVYQLTISGINRLHELEEAGKYLVKLVRKRMKDKK